MRRLTGSRLVSLAVSACAMVSACSSSSSTVTSPAPSAGDASGVLTLGPAVTAIAATTTTFTDPRSTAPPVPPATDSTTIGQTLPGASDPAASIPVAGTTPVSRTTTSSRTTPATTTATAATSAAALACIAKLPVQFKAGQLVWPSVQGEELVKQTPIFASWGVGGAVVMTYPASANGEQLLAFKNAGQVPLLLATDEEGGNVQRFKRVGALPIPAAVPGTMTPDQIEQAVAAHAKVIKALGIDVVYGPIADVSPLTGAGPIGNRAFSSDPNLVAAYDAAYVKGWESAGILPVIKHFPGHGSASADSHKATATTPSLDQLEARDLLPYSALVDSGAGVMVGHLTVPGLTDSDGVPASLSHAAISGLLRGTYGYKDSLVFTDALGMQAVAIKFKVPVAAEMAIEAGADVAIFTSTADAPIVIAQIVAAERTGRLTAARLDDAVSHVLRTKHIDPCTLKL